MKLAHLFTKLSRHFRISISIASLAVASTIVTPGLAQGAEDPTEIEEQQWEAAMTTPDVSSIGATSAALEVGMACMKQAGLIGESAETAVVYGSVSDGKAIPPTGTPRTVSSGCRVTAFNRVSEILETSLTEAEMSARLTVLTESAKARVGDFGPTPVTEEPLSPDPGSPTVTYDTYTYWVERKGAAIGITQFMNNRFDKDFLNWSTDRCTFSPDNPGGYPFWRGCIRHDFGWRNLKDIQPLYGRDRWTRFNKSVSDTQFKIDLRIICMRNTNPGTDARTRCNGWTDTYEYMVRQYGMNTHGMWNYSFNF